MQHLEQVLGFKIDNPGSSRGLNMQIRGSFHLFWKCYNEFLIFCMELETNTVQRLAAVSLRRVTCRLLVFHKNMYIY